MSIRFGPCFPFGEQAGHFADQKARTIRLCARYTVLLFFILGVANLKGQNLQSVRSDTQEWNDVQLAVPVTKSIDFNLLGVLRIGRDIQRPVDERIGAGFSFRFGKYLTVAPNYLHIATQPFRNIKLFENRLSLPVTLRFPAGQFRFSDRNLLERRFRRIASTRYRNKLQIEHSIGPKKINLSVFVADEVFYDWSINHWVRNRFQIGGSKVFDKHLTADIYYLRQNDSHSLPGNLNVIGTALRFRL